MYTVPLNKLLVWLESMKQKGGYAGPVTHYWGNSLNYIGPAFDWRYEGLITGFILLYKKTHDQYFLDRAIECGDFLCDSQLQNGSFPESGFESNPAFGETYQPHQAGSLIGVLSLAKFLKENKKPSKKYLDCGRKNAEFILERFFSEQENVFLQYELERASKVPNPIVPNKICTICEAMLLYHSLFGNEFALQCVKTSMDKVISLQEKNKGPLFGGIYQSNLKHKLITYYTARCVPCLVECSQIFNEKKYSAAAKNAVLFVKNHFTKNGFDFGYSFENGVRTKHIYPVFAAGSADILRALLVHDKKIPGEMLSWFFSLQNQTGAFRNFIGLQHRNTAYLGPENDNWKDHLPSVGWNDKVLRLFSMLVPKSYYKSLQEFINEVTPIGSCIYSENVMGITIKGTEKYIFMKNEEFSNNFTPLKSAIYAAAKKNKVPALTLAGKFILKKAEGI